MKLTEDQKTELRKKVYETTMKVPEGQRLKLDKELLEELIFFHGRFADGREFKVPIWTGDFLSKIDLSEISFDNCCIENAQYLYDNNELSEETVSRLSFPDKQLSHNAILPNGSVIVGIGSPSFPYIIEPAGAIIDDETPFINFKNTNIKIDFSKMYGSWLEGWNLSGVDLSKSNIEVIEYFDRCNLSNTNLKSSNLPILNNLYIRSSSEPDVYRHIVSNTDFSNNDLSEIDVIVEQLVSDSCYNINLSNTGVRVDMGEYDGLGPEEQIGLKKEIKRGNLKGCYINGILIDEFTSIEDIMQSGKDPSDGQMGR